MRRRLPEALAAALLASTLACAHGPAVTNEAPPDAPTRGGIVRLPDPAAPGGDRPYLCTKALLAESKSVQRARCRPIEVGDASVLPAKYTLASLRAHWRGQIGLAREEIAAVVNTRARAVRSCDSSLTPGGPVTAPLTLDFLVDASGRVPAAVVSNAGFYAPTFERCVVEAFEAMRFRPPVGGDAVIVTLQLVPQGRQSIEIRHASIYPGVWIYPDLRWRLVVAKDAPPDAPTRGGLVHLADSATGRFRWYRCTKPLLAEAESVQRARCEPLEGDDGPESHAQSAWATASAEGGDAPEGGLDKSEIRVAIVKHRGAVRSCYELLLQAQTASGHFHVNFAIGPSGGVLAAVVSRADFYEPTFERCILDVFEGMHFPPPRGGGVVTTTFPLFFKVQ